MRYCCASCYGTKCYDVHPDLHFHILLRLAPEGGVKLIQSTGNWQSIPLPVMPVFENWYPFCVSYASLKRDIIVWNNGCCLFGANSVPVQMLVYSQLIPLVNFDYKHIFSVQNAFENHAYVSVLIMLQQLVLFSGYFFFRFFQFLIPPSSGHDIT